MTAPFGQISTSESEQPVRAEQSLVLSVEPHLPIPIKQAPRPSRPHRILLLTGIGLLTVAAFLLWQWKRHGPTENAYKLAQLDVGPVTALVTATGTVNPVISVQVGSQVSGIVKRLYADFNSVVKEGQLLAEIDVDPFEAKLNQAKANLLTARANVDKARTAEAQRRLDLRRTSELRPQGFVSQSDVDVAKTNYRDAQAQVEVMEAQVAQAEAALKSAELDLSHTKITSPVNGSVVSRNVEVGQTVAASFQAPTLFVIAQDLTKMQVDTNVSESDIGGVKEGKEAEFSVDAYPNRLFHGLVAQVRNAPLSIQNVVTYDVVINVDNRDLDLKPGMTANVSIITARKERTLRVPNAALRFRMPGSESDVKATQVWTLDESGRPHSVPIKPGIVDPAFTEVREGDVREGNSIIVGLETNIPTAAKPLPPGFVPGTPR